MVCMSLVTVRGSSWQSVEESDETSLRPCRIHMKGVWHPGAVPSLRVTVWPTEELPHDTASLSFIRTSFKPKVQIYLYKSRTSSSDTGVRITSHFEKYYSATTTATLRVSSCFISISIGGRHRDFVITDTTAVS